MKKFFLYVNTIKYLKWQQFYFRLLRKLVKSKVTDTYKGKKAHPNGVWEHSALYNHKVRDNLDACFLNHSKKLDLPADWNVELPSKLWVYNLHYFEDLLSENAFDRKVFLNKFLGRWVSDNPLGSGYGWEPYPSSLRIANILKAWLGGLKIDEEVLRSTFLQASYLSNNIEKHLLGNHFFVNLKALFFAGVIFENNNWLATAERGLLTEIPEQILQDGANFELSPMYHSLILVDMLDMLNLSRAFPESVSNELVFLFERYIPEMLRFMAAMSHPDGEVSFFNDSSKGVAPANKKIQGYAKQLGFQNICSDINQLQVVDNHASGYFCATAYGSKLIFDAAAVGPDYIPGHAHADTLSFEMSVGCERVFVNTGTSEYGLTENRINQRKTRSHNTVE
ncbi:MAG: alginate lyase family protein, partial [Alphaproteobacteria bacterium]|nr:alginate lyase family protein [Alphaproteobacteria bacterium]